MQNPDDIGKDPVDGDVDPAGGDESVDVGEATQDELSEAQEAVSAAVEKATGGTEDPPAVAFPPAAPVETRPAVAPVAQPATVAPAAYPTVPGTRPSGITVLAIVSIAWGLLNLLLGLGGLGLGTLWGAFSSVVGEGAWGLAGAAFGMTVTGVAWLAAGGGLLALKPWAWLLALIATGIGFLGALWSMFTGNPICGLFNLILPCLILFYLTRPHVRAAFGR